MLAEIILEYLTYFSESPFSLRLHVVALGFHVAAHNDRTQHTFPPFVFESILREVRTISLYVGFGLQILKIVNIKPFLI